MRILAVNPWIVDFAAHDFWLKPYGFLTLLTGLRRAGHEVHYLDCTAAKITRDPYGRGKFRSETVEKPGVLANFPREFKRYGIAEQEFLRRLPASAPDIILLTSSMTYWYPGVARAAELIKKRFPRVPLILGGTYATLCREHAKKNIPCDRVVPFQELTAFLNSLNLPAAPFSELPAYRKFYDSLDYLVFRTSWGCPFRCGYCAIGKLSPQFFRLPVNRLVEYILAHARRGIRDFVIYDDAFLYGDRFVENFLSRLIDSRMPLRIHTPNALHLCFLNERTAALMKTAGFINPHFGLETLDPALHTRWNDKVGRHDLSRALQVLSRGGYRRGEFSVYMLLGYPGQDIDRFLTEAETLHEQGAKISLAEYSPVPGTAAAGDIPEIEKEPLLQNNSLLGASLPSGRTSSPHLEDFWRAKNFVRRLNRTFGAKTPSTRTDSLR
ncbi:MAG: radical SAM protein [Candidatus Omnitrophica bacterium]|nr:radical SAM protein [Candidatus Omnitrophota bacterium]